MNYVMQLSTPEMIFSIVLFLMVSLCISALTLFNRYKLGFLSLFGGLFAVASLVMILMNKPYGTINTTIKVSLILWFGWAISLLTYLTTLLLPWGLSKTDSSAPNGYKKSQSSMIDASFMLFFALISFPAQYQKEDHMMRLFGKDFNMLNVSFCLILFAFLYFVIAGIIYMISDFKEKRAGR